LARLLFIDFLFEASHLTHFSVITSAYITPSQRAFRQRKEEYIKSLKDQVKEYETLSENYKAVQAENYQLRDYIINLQQRLLESQVPLPEAPASINLSRHPQRPVAESTAGPSMSVSEMQEQQLQAAARQATAASERQHSHEEAQYLPGSQPFPAKIDGSGGTLDVPYHARRPTDSMFLFS